MAHTGRRGEDLRRSSGAPLASSWILTPITSAEKDAKTGGAETGAVGKDIDFDAVLVGHAQQKHGPQIIKYHLIL